MEPVKVIAIVDEFGEIDRLVKAFAPTLRRHEELKKQIQSLAADKPAEVDVSLDGRLYQVQISARKLERKIVDVPRVFVMLGKKRFLELCSMTLKALESAITPDRFAEIVVEDRTGSRTITAVAKASPAVLDPMPPAKASARRQKPAKAA